jgi:hypothetical protein
MPGQDARMHRLELHRTDPRRTQRLREAGACDIQRRGETLSRNGVRRRELPKRSNVARRSCSNIAGGKCSYVSGADTPGSK